MHPAWLLSLTVIIPFACLGLLLLLSWLEDTLDEDVRRAERRRVPAPIRAIPVPVAQPTARPEPAVSPSAVPSASPAVRPGAGPVGSTSRPSATVPPAPGDAALGAAG